MTAKNARTKVTQSARQADAVQDMQEVIDKSPESTTKEISAIIAENHSSFSGPLPPPDMFRQYDQVLPGSADRILSLAENEQSIRKQESIRILKNDATRIWGSILVSLALILAGVACAYLGEPILGGVFGLSGIFSGLIKGVIRITSQRG